MLHQLSEKIALFLFEINQIEEKDREVCSYGMEIFLSSMIGILLAIGIGFVFHELFRVCLFLVSFIMIRSFAGGYHAESHWKCISLFGVVSFLSIYVNKLLEGRLLLLGTLIILTAAVLLRFAPLENENRSLNAEEKRSFREKTRHIVLALLGIILLGIFLGPTGYILSAGLAVGMMFSGFSLLVALIMERRKKHETVEIT